MSQPFSILPEGQTPEYIFAGFRLQSDGTLLRGNQEIHLPPKELAALKVLLAYAGRIVSPARLKNALWGDVHVTAESVPRCVSSLRSALLPDECIQTVYKRGYRLTTRVERRDTEPATTLPRLAIMPFAAGFQVPAHMGPATTEELMRRLSGRRGVQRIPCSILARDSVFALAQSGRTPQQLGEALHADLVLSGSLRELPAQMQLRAELLRVSDGVALWIEDFLVPRSRIAGLESELAERILMRLGRGGLSIQAASESDIEDEIAPGAREAYERFQQGHQEIQTAHRLQMQDGLQNLQRATELDPSLISAQVDLVNACLTQTFYGFMSPSFAAERVRRTAKVIPNQLDGASSILPALGWIRFHLDHNLEGAQQAFAASAHLPHDPWTTRARVMFALGRHRFEEAIAILQDALAVDPYSPLLNARLAWALHLSGKRAESMDQIETCLKMFDHNEGANIYAAMILAYNGEAERAIGLAENLLQRSPLFDIATAALGYAQACAGRNDEASAIVERLQWLSRERYVSSSFTAAVCVKLGDLDDAMAELRAAEEARCPWFFQTLADPRLFALHDLPEFVRMRKTLEAMEATVEERADWLAFAASQNGKSLE